MKYRTCFVLLSLCACEDATTAAGSGGPNDPPIVEPETDPTLAEQLEGTWYLSATRCGGNDVAVFDSDQTMLTFSSESVDIVTATSQCLMTIPLAVHYDEAASAIRGDATGAISCVPADCNSLCGSPVSALLPSGLAADVTIASDVLTLTSADPAVFPTMACLQNEEEAPAELELVRDGIYPGTPFEWSDIDPTICDDFD
ncbi:MAG TPA: hypothetical protein VFB62_26185, partial [Polyangiaceae bacterium]|nr:hypothetical protein [Polyangiaceae bacterium]